MQIRLLQRKDVEKITGMKRSSIYKKMSTGDFPKPIKVGTRAVRWCSSDIDSWIERKICETKGELL